jgi:predicted acylesterase/phospholipase RssA
MAKKLDRTTAAAAREDARRLEQQANSTEPYTADTVISQPNAPSRMFNVRLSEEQYEALQELARQRHLPMSTMARAWLLDRLDHERHAS